MKYILLIAITTVFFSCKNTEKVSSTSDETKKETKTEASKPSITKEALFITMKRTPCFGKCPSYKIMIFNTGYVSYEGFSHTQYIGKYTNQLTKKQLKELQQMMDDIDITGMKDVYDSEVTDLPSTILFVVSNHQHKKKILDRVDAPASLKQFEKLIDYLVINDNLVQLPTNK